MRFFHKMSLRIRSLFRRAGVDRELSDELRFHLEREVEEKTTQGMTPEEARYAALSELGGVEQIKEEQGSAEVGAVRPPLRFLGTCQVASDPG